MRELYALTINVPLESTCQYMPHCVSSSWIMDLCNVWADENGDEILCLFVALCLAWRQEKVDSQVYSYSTCLVFLSLCKLSSQGWLWEHPVQIFPWWLLGRNFSTPKKLCMLENRPRKGHIQSLAVDSRQLWALTFN